MANNCIILGKSGTGKSTAIKGLNPDETVIINVLNKRLPFKGSSKLYTKEKKNIAHITDYNVLISALKTIGTSAEYKHVKNIVLDDVIYIMQKEYFDRAKETGFNKFVDLAIHFQQIISTCESLREDLNVFFILHSEDVVSDGIIVGSKVRTVGKLLDSQYSPVEVVPMVLVCDVKYNETGEAVHGFYTRRVKQETQEIPAKSPDLMFEDLFIPNDLGIVTKAMEEYYNEI